MTIAKRIPVAGGMAGGSADAAAALVACNELWGTGLSQAGAVRGSQRSRQRRRVRRARRHRSGPRPRRTTHPGAGLPARVPLGPSLRRRPPVHPGRLPRAGQAAAAPAVPEPELSTELMAALRAGDVERLGAAIQRLAGTRDRAVPRATQDAGRRTGGGRPGALVSGSGPTCYFLAATPATPPTWRQPMGAGVCRSVATATGPAAGASVIELAGSILRRPSASGARFGCPQAPRSAWHPQARISD